MELLLHIGAAKTGTTTIQKFLYANRGHLKSQGFHLLQSPGLQNNRALASICIRKDRYVGFYHYNRIDSPEKKLEFDRSVIANLTHELSEASQWAHTVISTSEDYYGGLLNVDEIQTLRSILQPWFSRIKVVMYIRSQVETLSSLYSTFLKNGEVVTLDSFVKERCTTDSNVYNFFKGVEMWSEVFGKRNMCVRLFDQSAFDNKNLLEDFSNQLGPGIFSALSQNIKVQNQSLTPIGQRLALAVNKRLPAFSEEHGWNKRNRAVIAFISRYFSGKGASLDTNATAFIEDLFYESNKLLHENYFSEHETLFSRTKQLIDAE